MVMNSEEVIEFLRESGYLSIDTDTVRRCIVHLSVEEMSSIYVREQSGNEIRVPMTKSDVDSLSSRLRTELGMNIPPRAQRVKIELGQHSLALVTCVYYPTYSTGVPEQ